MKILTCALLLCSTAAFGKESGQMKVSDLKAICDATSDAESVAAFKFYVLGVVEGLQIGIPILSLTADASLWRQPRYRSVVSTER